MGEHFMKITVNGRERHIQPGSKMGAVVEEFEESVRNDPMIISLKQSTGKSQLLFILNGEVVTTKYEAIELRDGDDVRMVHPYFGG
jgi:sulfur carrier protein ThiS